MLLLTISMLGTLASQLVFKTDRSAAFYFTPLKFYEFALGGLAAMLPRFNSLQNSILASGLATIATLVLILLSSVIFSAYTALPGVMILVPILGT